MFSSFNKIIFLLCQYCLPQHAVSRLLGVLVYCKWPVVKNFMINYFIKRYKIDLSVVEYNQLDDYHSFNHFFTRALKPQFRPINKEQGVIVSPVDGCIAQVGNLKQNLLLQAKGKFFTVDALLAAKQDQFYQGSFVTFYLSPRDYHRVHIPIDGELQSTTYIPGKLFSVNKTATSSINNVFARNERLVCYFDTAVGPMAVIFVGAMLVGNIETVWGSAEKASVVSTKSYNDGQPLKFAKGEEIGRFNMGSSVIVLFGQNRINWEQDLVADKHIQMGEKIGACINS